MIWPPWNAISIRMLSPSTTRHHLREDPADGVRMDECNLQAEQPLARRLVDELGAGGGELVERRPDVAHLVRDVMHPLAALGEESADRGIVAERREQLDAPLAEEQGCRLDALLRERVAVLEAAAEEPRVRLERVVEVEHGHAEMVNTAGDHAPRC